MGRGVVGGFLCMGLAQIMGLLFHNSLNVKHGPMGRRVAVSCLTFNELRKEWQRSANGGKSPLALLLTLKNHATEILENCNYLNGMERH